ncbi:10878_t:CDS:1 [Acaulospora morrowiae]|uniref:10878_t:CDS:1 n=1 Tax=Acaulospora morrowiae TaxID=94023 RepID=A0A9N9IX33_9GLOM|nr:10878_t:CDS:1 [Acaulospora morrowiae]
MNNQQDKQSICNENSQSSSDNEGTKDFGTCVKCQQPNTGHKWCKPYNVKRFEYEQKDLTSGDKDVDEFIREIQVNANESKEFIEYISYDKFKEVEKVADGGFGIVFKAIWKEGYIE